MTTATTSAASTTRTPTAPASRICATCKKNALSYNNITGICGECQRSAAGFIPKKATGHNGMQPRREPQAPAPHLVGQQGANRDDAAPRPPLPGSTDADGNRAHAAEDRNLSPGTPAELRVDLLLAAVPLAEKAKMLCAWLHGTL
jgi:hypothetical protein